MRSRTTWLRWPSCRPGGIFGALRDPGAFGGWLKRLAVNVWLADARRAAPPIDDNEEAFLAAADPAPSPERAAGRLDLERALATLKPDERLCVVSGPWRGHDSSGDRRGGRNAFRVP